jgi:hypothetical protein
MNLQEKLLPQFNPRTDYLITIQLPSGHAYLKHYYEGCKKPTILRVKVKFETGEIEEFTPESFSRQERISICKAAYRKGIHLSDLALVFKTSASQMNNEVLMSSQCYSGKKQIA